MKIQPSLLEEARRFAEQNGQTLDELINTAVAEKLSAIRTEAFFRERSRKADIPHAIEILEQLGKGNPPMVGDEL